MAIRGGDATPGLGALLPPDVVAVEVAGAVDPDELLAGEPAIVAKAVEHRRLEFARGRSCARRALAVLAVEPTPILAGADRAPIWPPGVVGSITHSRDYCCAAVARSERWSTIGIDAEHLQPIEPGVQQRILLDVERAQLERLDPAIAWPCVVFSAKEAIYKAWYPLARRWLDFHDVAVRLDAPAGRFEAELLLDEPVAWPRIVEGRFGIDRGRVLATVLLSRS